MFPMRAGQHIIPEPAINAGFSSLALSDDFGDLSTIDTGRSGTDGYHWYTIQPYGWSDNPTLTTPEPSVLRIKNNNGNINWNLCTVNPLTSNGFTADRGYFEAKIRFDQTLGTATDGWPSWWSLGAQYVRQQGQQRPAKWKEIDFFEAGHEANKPWPRNHLGTVHEWSFDGTNQTSSPNSIGVTLRDMSGVNTIAWHTYGCLITDDRIIWYLDGYPMYTLETGMGWDVVANHDPLAFVLGTGTNWPMDVDWVRLWTAGPAEIGATYVDRMRKFRDGSARFNQQTKQWEASSAPTVKVSEHPQRTYATAQDAATALGLPSDAQLVTWNSAWADLETAHKAVATSYGTNAILVLPERTQPYAVDMGKGFMSPSDITAVDGWSSKTNSSRMFFAGTRGSRGIVGLGPGARLSMTNSTNWTAPAQGPDQATWGYTDSGKGHVAANDGLCQVVQFDVADCWVANLVVDPGLDLGGVAYNFFGHLKKAGNRFTAKRVSSKGGWYGFADGPCGETGLFGLNSASYLIEDCWADGQKPDGSEFGTSPLMVNNATSGTINRVMLRNAKQGMPTWYQCNGTHTITDLYTEGHPKQQINLEKCYTGAVFNFLGGSVGVGDNGQINLAVGDYAGDIEAHFDGTSFAAGAGGAGSVSVQEYSNGMPKLQTASKVTAVDVDGRPLTVKIYQGV